MNGTALLLHGQRRDPDRNQAILAEWQTKTWMGDDLQEELAVLTTMNQLPGRRAAQGESAEHEWAGVVRQLLTSIPTLFSNELDGVELLVPQLCDRNRVQNGAHRYEARHTLCAAIREVSTSLLARHVWQKHRKLQKLHTCTVSLTRRWVEPKRRCSGVPKSVPKRRRLGAQAKSRSY